MLSKLFRDRSGRIRVWLVALLVVVSLGIAATAWAYWPKVDDDNISLCAAYTGSSQQITLPRKGALYYVQSQGNSSWILCGTNPTATASANGHFAFIPEGGLPYPLRLTGAKCAFIAPSAAGQVCLIYLDETL